MEHLTYCRTSLLDEYEYQCELRVLFNLISKIGWTQADLEENVRIFRLLINFNTIKKEITIENEK